MRGVGLLLIVVLAGGIAPAQVPDRFADCDREVVAHPDDEEAYRCYVAVAARQNGWAEAARRLEALVAVQPENTLATLTLASVEARRGGSRAESLYRAAIERLTERGRADHEVTARLEYARFLARRERVAESEEQLQHATEVARRSGQALLSAWVELHLAQADYYRSRYEAAEQRLQGIRGVLFREGSVYHRSTWLGAAGSARWGMNRVPEAIEDFRQQAELLRSVGDLYEEAIARSNIALLASRTADKGETVRLVEIARDTAVRGGNHQIEGKCELYLAQLADDVRARRKHAEQGLRLSRENGNVADSLLALRLLSESLAQHEPRDAEQALRRVGEAVEVAETSGSLQQIARSRLIQSVLRWDLLREGNDAIASREEATRSSLAALDAIEAIRDNQTSSTLRARTFAPWARFYSVFIGNLLWPPEAIPPPDDVDRAFRIAERMRARVFLDELDVANVADATEDLPWGGLPGLAEVRDRLSANEAVLSFVTADTRDSKTFLGGSWLTLITAEEVGVYRVPERSQLSATLALTVGSIRNRDGSARAGLERLYEDLIEPALRGLPDEVDHLIIVPDGPLHGLPFGALRSADDDEPLGARYRISRAPSVASWLHWAQTETEPARYPAIVWIDPAVGAASEAATDRNGRLGRLPHAVLEARAARGHLGSAVRVESGERVTEARFKEANLEDHAIVHIAAHAVVDELHPDLSGIVLVSGGEQDGLLQVREIVELELDGRIVILSACRSASGARLEGEGVLSLTRAFFVAGAQAVLANLWPVRDDEAAALSSDLYRYLGEGESLAEALTSARRARLDAGAPAEAWAGTVLYGNGRMSPFDGRPRRAPWSWLQIAALAGLVAIGTALRGVWLHRSSV